MENISFVHSAQFGFQTPVYCIISDERVHRIKSPRMYNRILQQMGLAGAFVPFMVAPDDLGPFGQDVHEPGGLLFVRCADVGA